MSTYFSFILSLFILFPGLLFAKCETTLRDKIGQMLIVGFDGASISKSSSVTNDIDQFNIGGVILFDYNYKKLNNDKNIKNPTQVKKLNKALQEYNFQSQKKHHRLRLPLLISIDYEGGKVSRLDQSYGFKATLSQKKVGNKNLKQAKLNAGLIAKTLADLGFNLNFSPVVDLDLNPKNLIIGKKERSFSADPKIVSLYANIYSEEYKTHNILCSYKHFPGHGSSTNDSHLGFVDISQSWNSFELQPYKELIGKNVSCNLVMVGHLINRQLDSSGLPASLSYKIINEVLRKQLHFSGVVISDDMQMKAISSNYELGEALKLSINAGIDMLIFGNNLTGKAGTSEVISIIEKKVLTGEIKKARIDEAYQHILKLKGLLIAK